MDKQDELAVVVCLARLGVELHGSPEIDVSDVDLRIAAAVRSFMGSPEIVERMAKAHCDQFGGDGWWETGLIKDTLPVAREAMRTALSAAIGGQDAKN